MGVGVVCLTLFFTALGPIGPCATGPQMVLLLLGLFGIAAGFLLSTLALLTLIVSRHKRGQQEPNYPAT